MKNNKLHNIKSTGFKTPNDYFDAIEETIFSKINTKSVLNEIETPGFKVPDTYFETFNDSVLNKLQNKKNTKVIPLFSKTNLIYVSSIAAAILLLFNLSVFESKPTFDNLDMETVENYLEDESISTYEIAALFGDQQINEDHIIDYNFNDENIEEYLLNNADIEALILD